MKNVQEKILTIEKVNFTGKWVEFWFEEEKKYNDVLDENYLPTGEKIETWSMCTKGYMLWNAAENSGIISEIYNTGFRGKKLKWSYESTNYYLIGFV